MKWAMSLSIKPVQNYSFNIISDWYETKSIIITSSLEISGWNKVFIDPRLTSALVDRLIHHAHILTFTGENYSLKDALSNKKYWVTILWIYYCIIMYFCIAKYTCIVFLIFTVYIRK